MAKNRRLTRRRTFLLGLGAAVGAGTFAMASKARQLKNYAQPIRNDQRDFAVSGEAPLRDRAAKKGLLYGAATQYPMLFQNSEFANQFAQECGILVPALELKAWNIIHPSLERFDFSKADRMAKFARTHNMLLHGTTLVWHKGLPKWFEDTVNQKNAEQVLVKHIKTIAGHYAGKMHSWDVVNEAVRDQGTSELRPTPWMEFLGRDYIDIAFRTAAAADPSALLVYNDYGLEDSSPKSEAKRTKVLKLLERLKSSGVPIHALGLQSHLGVDRQKNFNPQKLRDFIKDVASLGLKILVTELDVVEKQALDVAERDRLVASVYEDYLSVVLEEPAVISVITWGLSDRYTWLAKRGRAQRQDDEPIRPLPLDAQMERKLAWNAIARAFDKAPMRSS